MKPRAYLGVLAGTTVLICVAVLGLSWLIDPLWYFAGNRLTGMNYPFNERYAKLVRWERSAANHDCAIFGSSRTTVLNEHDLAGHDCFNFAVSGGVVAEFVEMARYLRDLGFAPRLVVVGVDGFNFSRAQGTGDLPDFVHRRARPPSPLQAYLSVSTLRFSVRTLRGDSRLARYYRADFTGALRPDVGPAELPSCIAAPPEPVTFSTDAVSLYRELEEVWPAARFVGYVPPLSVWDIAVLELDGTLDAYLAALHRTAALFERFYDFSVPSPETADPVNTADGDHYNEAINRRIAARLNGGAGEIGLEVTGLSLQRYGRIYREALQRQLASLRLPVGPPAECYHASNAG